MLARLAPCSRVTPRVPARSALHRTTAAASSPARPETLHPCRRSPSATPKSRATSGDKSSPAVIVIQEWWGVTENIQRQALKLSEDGGFRCIVPDLYKGKLGDVEEAHHQTSSIGPTPKTSSSSAPSISARRGPRRWASGFLHGRSAALIAAQHADDVAAPFYGTPDPSICQTDKITKPVQAHFGELDNLAGFSDPDAAKKLLANLRAAGSDCELHMYPNVGHAFMNDLPAPYPDWDAREKTQGFPRFDSAQVNAAWSRLLEFFRKHLA